MLMVKFVRVTLCSLPQNPTAAITSIHGHSKSWTYSSPKMTGSVAEYINEMRASKESGSEKQMDFIRKELSMREIQRTIEHNLQSSAPKKKSTEERHIQYDDMTSDSPSSPSACLESESLWQSLSSASRSEE